MCTRLKITYAFIFVLIGLLAARLAFIQIVKSDEYTEVAASQYRVNFEGIDRRGIIYDRSLKPITGVENNYVFIFSKEKVDDRVNEIFKSVNGKKVSSQNKNYTVFTSKEMDKSTSMILKDDYDAFIMEVNNRYKDNQPAVHLIGHLNNRDKTGATGIEKDYEEVLTEREKHVYGVADATGKIIPGKGIETKSRNDSSGVITTLDMDVQAYVENALKNSKYSGAVVVADVSSGAVLACGSSPAYNPNAIEKYLKSSRNELINRGIQGLYPPGSVFKIVVAATAFEEQIVTRDKMFYCKGFETINGIKINCSKKEGHGYLTFQDAFAKSCNSVFIQLGQRVGGEKILNMAKRFELDKRVLKDITNEKKGILPEQKDVVGAGIGNLSIGQGSLLLTPVDVAKMTMIIANNGKNKDLKLIEGIKSNGETKFNSEKNSPNIISEEIAKEIKEMMKETAITGTGRNLALEGPQGKVAVAVKTGSAETNVKGEYAVHGWITGFFPADNPEYVITVLVEKGGNGSNGSIPIFQEVAENIVKASR